MPDNASNYVFPLALKIIHSIYYYSHTASAAAVCFCPNAPCSAAPTTSPTAERMWGWSRSKKDARLLLVPKQCFKFK